MRTVALDSDAFILMSHWPAHDLIFILSSLIDSKAMETQTQFRCYKTLDFRYKEKCPFLSFLLMDHVLSRHIPLFSLSILVPSPPSPSPSPSRPTFLICLPPPSVCTQLTPSPPVRWGRERCEGSMYVWIMEEASFSLTRCVWCPTSAQCVCVCSVCVCVCVCVCVSPRVLPYSPPPLFSVMPFLSLPQNPFRS